jgi:hypothetical protein
VQELQCTMQNERDEAERSGTVLRQDTEQIASSSDDQKSRPNFSGGEDAVPANPREIGDSDESSEARIRTSGPYRDPNGFRRAPDSLTQWWQTRIR